MEDDDDFRGLPFERPEEWIRLRKAIRKVEKAEKVIDALVVLVDAARIVKTTAPYAALIGGAILAYLNRTTWFGIGG